MANKLPKTCLFNHPCSCPAWTRDDLPLADQADEEKNEDPKRCRLRSSAVVAKRPNLASESATSEGRGREERAFGVAVARVAACETFCIEAPGRVGSGRDGSIKIAMRV